MHPDIVAQYNYVFLWDEDLGVENFHAERCSFLILHSSKNMDFMFLFLQIMSGVETVLRFDVQSYLPTLLSID